jgi:hypothetical protein
VDQAGGIDHGVLVGKVRCPPAHQFRDQGCLAAVAAPRDDNSTVGYLDHAGVDENVLRRLPRQVMAHHRAESEQRRAPVDLTVDLDAINGYHPLVHDPELHGRLDIDGFPTGGSISLDASNRP